jgi:hypothetical protein
VTALATALVSVALGAALLLNVLATILLIRSEYLTRTQKAAQAALNWLLPLVGSIVVIAVLRNPGTDRDSSPEVTRSIDGAWLVSSTPDADTFHSHSDASGHADS